jgi:hypothetical protein
VAAAPRHHQQPVLFVSMLVSIVIVAIVVAVA